MPKYKVTYEVEEVRGTCPMYTTGDKIVVEPSYHTECIKVKDSSDVCMRVMDNMWNNLLYVRGDEKLVEYLGGGMGEVRISCSMPGPPFTPCGYVIWRVKREKIE